MANYVSIHAEVEVATPVNAPQVLAARVVPALVDIWLGASGGLSDNVVETTSDNYSYRFDIGHERLIAAIPARPRSASTRACSSREKRQRSPPLPTRCAH
jgi:hypothetical protein